MFEFYLNTVPRDWYKCEEKEPCRGNQGHGHHHGKYNFYTLLFMTSRDFYQSYTCWFSRISIFINHIV